MSTLPDAQKAESSTSSQKSYESSSSLPRFASVRQQTPSFERGESSSPDSGRSKLRKTPDITEQPTPIETVDHGSRRSDHSSLTDPKGSRRHRHNHSGGFLLDSVFAPATRRLSHGSLSHKHPDDGKGKRHGEDGGLVVPKRRSHHRHQRAKESIGRSPLAIEQSSSDLQEAKSGENIGGITSSTNSSPHINGNSRTGSTTIKDSPPASRHTPYSKRNQTDPVPAIGFDTDPAQIVNLALNLSENRRRAFSGGRVVSDGSRRIVSHGPPSTPSLDAQNYVRQGGSLRQHLMQQRKTSRNVSPGSIALGKSPIAPRVTSQTQSRYSSSVPDAQDEASDDDLDFDVSESTLARVAKAKQHFELCYEHRRLISVLPPLRHSSKSARDPNDKDNYEPGRAYDPLQYIRNRKLRWREKKPLLSEADGWSDIQKVRPWVNAVIEDHREPSRDPDECLRLPPLQDERNEPEEDSSPASTVRRPPTGPSNKPRRPRMDWIISPQDLLADDFWLEQGLNKTRIVDGDGNKLYPRDVQLNFTGWRNRAPALVTQDSTPLSINSSAEKLQTAPELPKFRSHSSPHGVDSKGRGRKRRQIRDSIHNLHHNESPSRDRTSRLKKTLTRSESISSSTDSDSEGFRGRRKRKNAGDHLADGISSAALEKQMLEMLERDNDADFSLAATQTKQSSLENDDNNKSLRKQVSLKEPGEDGVVFNSDIFKKQARSQSPVRTSPKLPTISSPLSSDDQDRGRRSEEMDSTAPNSPTGNGYIPSIAINLSPPTSRSPSPTKKPLPARLFRPDRNKSKQRQGISAGDFGAEQNEERPDRSSAEAHHPTDPRDRTASPKTKRDSLTPEDTSLTELRRMQSAQVKALKPLAQQDSRRRGIFKGGRIAEIVGNEVSRVGEFIWKREAPQHARAPSSASSVASADSGDELEPGIIPKSHLRRIETNEGNGRLARKTTEESPQYYMSNLPTFRSPFRQSESDTEVFKTSQTSFPDDHISRQQRLRREASRPVRFEQLAPPRINVRGVSPNDPRNIGSSGSPSNESRRDSYGFGGAMNANHRLNDALNDGSNMVERPPVTGLASLDVSNPPRNARPSLADKRDWSISHQSLSTSQEAPATKRDVARVRALLLSTGVKATEISRRAHTVRESPPDFLLQLSKEPLPSVPRKEEHVYAARILVHDIDIAHQEHQGNLEKFTNVTLPSLHSRLRDLDDLVSNNFISRARSAADDAGAQSSQLTTTRTLAVKQLNDGIDLVIRRRRRRIRWLRRLGYVLLEWTVLGLMWWVWLVVMMIKTVRGTIRAIVAVIRWILFL